MADLALFQVSLEKEELVTLCLLLLPTGRHTFSR